MNRSVGIYFRFEFGIRKNALHTSYTVFAIVLPFKQQK